MNGAPLFDIDALLRETETDAKKKAAENKDAWKQRVDQLAIDRAAELAEVTATGRYMPDVPRRSGVTLLAASVGSGKTRVAGRWAAEVDGSVLAICHRRSLVDGLGERLGVPTHLEARPENLGALGGMALCVDSIARVPDGYTPRLFVLEESEALLDHLLSGGTIPRRDGRRAHSGSVLASLKALTQRVLAAGGSVLVCDAHASVRTDALLAAVCPGAPITTVRHQRGLDELKVNWYDNPIWLIWSIIMWALKGERVYVSTTSKSAARRLKYLCDKARVSSLSYTADSGRDELKKLRDPVDAWRDVQVVIASPTIDAGLDYAPSPGERGFDRVVGFFPRTPGIGWDRMIQMLGRIRGATEYYVHVAQDRWDGRSPTVRAVATRKSAEFGRSLTAVKRYDGDDPTYSVLAIEHANLSHVRDAEARLYGRLPANCLRTYWDTKEATIDDVVPQWDKGEKAIVDAVGEKVALDLLVEPANWTLIGKTVKTERGRAVAASPVMDEVDYGTSSNTRTSDEILSREHSRLVQRFGQADDDGRIIRDGAAVKKMAELAASDESRRFTRYTERISTAIAIMRGDARRAASDDASALRTGYHAHCDGSSEVARAALLVLVIGGVNTVDLVRPPGCPRGVTAPGIRDLYSQGSDTPWSSDPSEDKWSKLLALLKQEGVDASALRALGVREYTSWSQNMGQTLQWLGIKTEKLGQRRVQAPGQTSGKGKQTAFYQVDQVSAKRMRALATPTVARSLGSTLQPLSSFYTGEEWRLAVGPTGWWAEVIAPPADSLDPPTSNPFVGLFDSPPMQPPAAEEAVL